MVDLPYITCYQGVVNLYTHIFASTFQLMSCTSFIYMSKRTQYLSSAPFVNALMSNSWLITPNRGRISWTLKKWNVEQERYGIDACN